MSILSTWFALLVCLIGLRHKIRHVGIRMRRWTWLRLSSVFGHHHNQHRTARVPECKVPKITEAKCSRVRWYLELVSESPTQTGNTFNLPFHAFRTASIHYSLAIRYYWTNHTPYPKSCASPRFARQRPLSYTFFRTLITLLEPSDFAHHVAITALCLLDITRCRVVGISSSLFTHLEWPLDTNCRQPVMRLNIPLYSCFYPPCQH